MKSPINNISTHLEAWKNNKQPNDVAPYSTEYQLEQQIDRARNLERLFCSSLAGNVVLTIVSLWLLSRH